jgi:hypothetical protein
VRGHHFLIARLGAWWSCEVRTLSWDLVLPHAVPALSSRHVIVVSSILTQRHAGARNTYSMQFSFGRKLNVCVLIPSEDVSCSRVDVTSQPIRLVKVRKLVTFRSLSMMSCWCTCTKPILVRFYGVTASIAESQTSSDSLSMFIPTVVDGA